MKRLFTILAIALACCATEASAQLKTAYFMEGSYFRTDMNPALAPTRGYIALPGMSGIGVSVSSNFLSVDNLLYKRDGKVVTFLHKSVSANDFLGKMPNTNKLYSDETVNILGVGWHTKRMFWNFGINLRTQAEFSLGKDIFKALKTLGNGRYDLHGSSVGVSAYTEIYVGAAIPIKEFATFGFRVKGLLGLANAEMKMEQMYANVTDNAVRAELTGSVRGNAICFKNNYMPGTKITSGNIKDVLLETNAGNMLKGIKSGGVAVDLGAEVRLLDDRLKVSGALTDLGFICWSKRTTANAQLDGNFSYTGIDFNNDSKAKTDSDFDAVMTEPTGGYTTRLNCALNLGVEYNILNNHIAFGLLSHTQFCQSMSYTELTASVNFRIGRSFSTTVSHTFLNHNKLGIFGFALNVHPTGFNLFLGADYIDCNFAKYEKAPVPKFAKSMNFYFGMGFNLGKAKYMHSMQPKPKAAKPAKATKPAKSHRRTKRSAPQA